MDRLQNIPGRPVCQIGFPKQPANIHGVLTS